MLLRKDHDPYDLYKKSSSQGFLTSRSPSDVFCQLSNLTTVTTSSIFLTISSIIFGVLSDLISKNNSVNAFLALISEGNSSYFFRLLESLLLNRITL